MTQTIKGLMKTHNCTELTNQDVGSTVKLCGWVNKKRDLGGLNFIDLRDKSGLIQLGFENFSGDMESVRKVPTESVIQIEGKVSARPESATNKDMKTGTIEVQVEAFTVLSECDIDNLPFLPQGKVEATEDLRLKYRYLDLRRERLQEILKVRSEAMQTVRNLLVGNGFTEVETPILYKSTPEGARDYLVPSRVHPSKVYALPQSPQTLKQLLMIGGTDKYFQICRCFRDEDLRADRQPEFSQIDIEVSFATQEYIKNLAISMVTKLFGLPEDFELPLMSFDDSFKYYGTDRPDLRFGLKQMIVTDMFAGSGFSIFESVAQNKGLIKALFVPSEMGTFSRKDTDGLTEVVKPYGGKGVAFFKKQGDQCSAGISKFVSAEILSNLEGMLDDEGKGKDGTWFFFADPNHEVAHACADAVRRHFGKSLNLYKDTDRELVWVYDFPLLEWDDDNGRAVARHHPFTSPKVEHMDAFLNATLETPKEELMALKAEAYDLVCNGYEIAGGSIRIHKRPVQRKMFELLGMSEEEVLHQFGFFIEALNYGTPPHGGIAFGFDRVIMQMVNTDSIRDVIAFPKTAKAADMMSDAPSTPAKAQLDELHMQWLKN
jgi:aspartyl-tRNA synthetase